MDFWTRLFAAEQRGYAFVGHAVRSLDFDIDLLVD